MSSEFYFIKWNETLAQLTNILQIDIKYQESKVHDQKRCDATRRLSSVLSEYMNVYNQVWQCWDMNLQVQKTSYIYDVLMAVVGRILELKHELKKLEVSRHHFFTNGLIEIKKTNDDIELAQIPNRVKRPEHIQTLIENVFEKCREKKKIMEEEANAKPVEKLTSNWWNDKLEEEIFEDKDDLTAEQKQINKYVKIIQAQERSRQVIQAIRLKFNERQRWKKELNNTAKPQASLEIRENIAKLIQKVCRVYFTVKRERQLQNKRDEMIGLLPCRDRKNTLNKNIGEIEARAAKLKEKYNADLIKDQEEMKQYLLKRKADEIREDYRDRIREWFREWYETINIFHEIPHESQGGVAKILKDDLPTPLEWLEEYQDYLVQKKANKTKTAMELKYDKMEAKREIIKQNKEKNMKKILEEQLRKKMLKNPSSHPGFEYPESKKTDLILKVIQQYHKYWDDLDDTEVLDVKEKYVQDKIKEHAFMLARLDIIPSVEEDMRKELKHLNAALKQDYRNNDEKMPQTMKIIDRKGKMKRKLKATLSDNIADKLEGLILQGIVIEYTKTKLEDFIGDPNFSGDDLRCSYGMALPDNGDIRNVWWESCHELTQGFRRILLVGPKGGGKTTLLHILASMNNAVLFELDASKIRPDLRVSVYLQQLVGAVVTCARVVQPAVIHVKCVHKLFYNRVPHKDAKINWELFRNYFVKKLFKKIHKTDKITVVGTCIDPWMTRSKHIVKNFPNVVLLPNTSYSSVVLIIRQWINNNAVIPRDLDISSLSYVLRGYSFGFIKENLNKFSSADRIAKIAAQGLSPKEIYDFFLDVSIEKVDYEKYLTWYLDKTMWGKKEKHHLQEQIAFRKAAEEFQRKKRKQTNIKLE